ncbi:MAG TPA: SpvB/TcaC N-terminal domain-containing protein, partial [Candidatus Nanoarchaeia archaeon]|nr:SpvB/TcaC N-terminal domain-containing protein [Candidatus Nanoarchaeia archaeon]
MNKTKPLGLKYVLYLLKKPTAFLLVFSFVVSPLSAFAQFSTTTATSTKSLSDELNGDFSFDSLSSSETGNLDVSRNMFNSKRFSSIDEISGTFNFEVPIAVPPGRNGIEPKLSLRYNSQPQTETSVVGYGWEIPIPFIERVNKRGTDRMFSDTYFYSSLSGELASTSATTYKAKVEDGDFFTYEFSSNSWTMKDRDGTIYKFGHSAATRQDDPNNSSNISKWLLEEIRDRNDNYMTYEYYKNYGQVYPSKITYTHSSTTPSGIFEVEFNRESRGDIATSSAVGFPVNTRQRIYEVVTKVDGVWARKYDLNYSNPEDRTRSLLTSVTEYGRADDGSTTTIPAYEFDYHESDPKGWTTNVPWTIPTFLAKSNGQSLGTLIADPNGDGRPDLLQSFQDATSTLNTVFLHNGSGWATSTWAYPWADYFTVATDTKPFFPGDINADGLDDFIHCSTNPASCNTYLSTGSGWATSTSVWSVPTGFENTAGNTSVRLIDLN